MSIKIHYGPPGSYKTSGLIKDDFPKAVLDGRIVVTNVRGLDDRERIVEIIEREFKKEVPDSFEIIWQEHQTSEGKEKWARWFHWVPLGSYLFVDEAQKIWRKSWRDKDLALLDYPGGPDKALEDKRPSDFLTSFEMHRHYGFDLALTTPNIKLIRSDIRDCSEGAFRHKNLALNGIPGRYLEAFHNAHDNGSASDLQTPRFKKIPSWVFELYASTSTGEFTDTKAGSNVFKDPKVLFLFGFLSILLVFLYFTGLPSIFEKDSEKSTEVSLQNNELDFSDVSSPAADSPAGGVSAAEPFSFNFLNSQNIWFIGHTSVGGGSIYLFEIISADEKIGSIVTSFTMEDLGYTIEKIDSSLLKLTNGVNVFFARSRGVLNEKNL